jgi:hypothetical protein
MPDVFINQLRKKDFIECQTLRIRQLNQRINDSHIDVVNQSDKVVSQLLVAVRCFAPEMFRVCESIALLDVLAAFGQIVTTQEYVRPQLDGRFAIKAARHPILEKVSKHTPHILADVDMLTLCPGIVGLLHTQRLLCHRAVPLPDPHWLQHEWKEYIHPHCSSHSGHGPNRVLCSCGVCLLPHRS